MSDRPRVAAICPTLPERAWCLPLALEALGQQMDVDIYQVVVGVEREPPWGESGVAPAPGHIMGSRWIRYASALTLGAKRQLLCEAVDPGVEWVAIWDDDDWHHPLHVVSAIEACIAQQADIGGMTNGYFVDLVADRAYRYDGEILGTSLVFRRSVLAWASFPNRERGEDAMFLRHCQAQGARVATWRDPAPVAFQHGQRTGMSVWPPTIDEFKEVSFLPIRALMCDRELKRWQAAYRDRLPAAV